MSKHVPTRTCIGCGKKAPKDKLFRIGVGRGAYLCPQLEECFNLAMKRKAFARALKGKLTNDEIEKVRQKLLSSFERPRCTSGESRSKV